MSKLPQTKAKDLVKVVKKLGFTFRDQSDSHAVYIHLDGRRTTIPIHPTQTIGIGLLTKIIKKDLQMSRNEFINLFKK